MSHDTMPFTQHLEELRRRLIACGVAIAVGFCVAYAFKEKIFEVLMIPWIRALPPGQTAKLIYTAPHEAFFTYMKVSFIAGIGVAMPVILHQIWCFIAPGLYTNERRYVVPIVFFSTIFFLGGALFGYFIVFPVGFQFFASFATENIAPMVSTKEFLTFTNRLLFAFGLIFELPIFAFFLAKLGLITAAFLRRQRRIAVVVIFIVAAALTPGPDVFSQLLMAGPLLVLYEASIWIAHIFGPKEEPETPDKQKEGHTTS